MYKVKQAHTDYDLAKAFLKNLDYQMAYLYFERSTQSGDPRGLYNLALMCLAGLCSFPNKPELKRAQKYCNEALNLIKKEDQSDLINNIHATLDDIKEQIQRADQRKIIQQARWDRLVEIAEQKFKKINTRSTLSNKNGFFRDSFTKKDQTKKNKKKERDDLSQSNDNGLSNGDNRGEQSIAKRRTFK